MIKIINVTTVVTESEIETTGGWHVLRGRKAQVPFANLKKERDGVASVNSIKADLECARRCICRREKERNGACTKKRKGG